jgi:GNAT superfamily N-acetyltransferase
LPASRSVGIIGGMAFRAATRSDLDCAVRTVTLAFLGDPVWSVALRRGDGRTDHLEAYWRFFVGDAIDQGAVRVADDGAAVSVWIPPGGEELRAETLDALDAFNLEALGASGAAEMAELYERFEANHRRAEPHAYLSLLATHPDHRGKGIGQALLADDLGTWDVAGVPAYLESTNPANDHRYERAGFRPVGGFTAVRDRARVTTMWREVRAAT